jgi:Ni/Co efflux regulator RcnB
MKIRHILMLATGIAALAAIPLAMAQQKGGQAEGNQQGAAAQQSADAQAQAEADARAKRRAAAAAQKDEAIKQGKLDKGAKEAEEEKPLH